MRLNNSLEKLLLKIVCLHKHFVGEPLTRMNNVDQKVLFGESTQ